MMLKGVDVADKEEEVDSTCTCISFRVFNNFAICFEQKRPPSRHHDW